MRIYLLAGEPSGDKLGAAIMAGLKTLSPGIEFRGVAGPLMQAEGMASLFSMDDLSVMGISEVLPRYPALKRRLNEATHDVLDWQPNALLTIDSPDFSLRLAKRVKAASDIRTIQYVAPSVWAWRPGRARKMARYIDQVLALLPFEPPYMEAAGVRCDFVGHPVVTEPVASPAEVEDFRVLEGLGGRRILLVLPGSRQSEIERMSPVFAEALAEVARRVPDVRVVVPAADAVAEMVVEIAKTWPGDPLVLVTGANAEAARVRKRAAFAAADAALATSGTVSLELAASGTPMVIAYDMSWLSWQIMSRLARVDTVTLVNLVSGTRVIPEFLGPECEPQPIAAALAELLLDPVAREAQIDAMSDTMMKLGSAGEPPGIRAARAVLDGLR